MNSGLRVVIALLLCALLSSCAAWLITPNGMKCAGGDTSIGGGNEAGAMADAIRDNCQRPMRTTPVRACCYKLLFVTQSCPLAGGYLPRGAQCYCVNPFTVNYGLACDINHDEEDEDDYEDDD